MPDLDHGSPATILTIGHSDRTWEEFVRLLRAHGVSELVDVRKLPGSRKHPQFDRDAMALGLDREGIAYVHQPGLAGRRRGHAESPNGAWKNASFRAFADYMLTSEFDEALRELLDRSRDQRSALMCAEAVPWRCHRSLIADALVVRGVAVEHILSAAKTRPHVLKPWAVVDGTRITYPEGVAGIPTAEEGGGSPGS